MGALNSRRMIMMIDDDDDSRSRIEDTSESDSMDSDSDSGGDHNFVEMLHNLLSSGQLLLQSGDDDFCGTRRAPKIKIQPNTTVLDKSEFSLLTKQACGMYSRTSNVTSLLTNRESGLYKPERFSNGLKAKITHQYIPNEMVGALEGSTGKVFCGIFSKDGNTFLTASQDRHIRLYNSKDSSYEMFKSIRARDVGWSIIDVTFSPDAEHFVYSTWSSSRINSILHTQVESVSLLSRDALVDRGAAEVYYTSRDINETFHRVHMCPVHGSSDHQEPLSLLNTSRRFCVFSVVYSSDGKELVCGANDGCLYIYDIERKQRTLKIPAHENDINRVLFADNSSHIIYSGGDDGLVKVWDRRTLDDKNCKPVGLLAGHMDGITYIDSRGDGRHLISNSKDQSIKLWDVRVFSTEDAANESLKAVRNQPWDYRWQGVPKELYQSSKLEGDTSIMTYRGHVVSKTLVRARFSPAETTGQRYIYTGCGYGRVVIYDSLTGKIVKQKKCHMACVRDVSWHPTRNEILSSSWDGLVGKWTYCKTSASTDKQDKSESRQPVRRSARLAALKRNKEHAE